MGLLYFLSIIINIFRDLRTRPSRGESAYVGNIRKSLLLFAIMNVFFAMASYGLSSYEWYLLAGLSLLIAQGLPAEVVVEPRRLKVGREVEPGTGKVSG